MDEFKKEPLGYRWRSSKSFIVATVAIALFIDCFLYGFLVPILPYMFENRLQVERSQMQRLTSAVLATHGFVAMISGPVIGHFADKTSSCKTPLLIALTGCIAGTVMICCAPSLPFLFFGRVLQGLAGSAAWIVGLATIADSLGHDNLGAVMGVVLAVANAGMISGPTVSGLLLELTGYWKTWTVPLGILVVDISARLLMIETPHKVRSDVSDTAETSSLLPRVTEPHPASTAMGFWRFILSDKRVAAALLIGIISTAIQTNFHTTLPLYTQKAFGWGTSRTGLMFFLLTFPNIMISPIAGMLRDRIGVRIPATAALLLQAAIMALLGATASAHLPWAGSGGAGPTLFTIGITAMGTLRPFVSVLGPVELTSVVREYEEETPGMFGPNGGYSRVSSMVDVTTHAGLTFGPILTGALFETFGYSWMAWSLSLLFIVLAILAISFLGPQKVSEEGEARGERPDPECTL